MSDLKHQDVPELQRRRGHTVSRIAELQSQLNGLKTRLEWIDHYIYQKTPVELSIRQIEARLGHRIIITEVQ